MEILGVPEIATYWEKLDGIIEKILQSLTFRRLFVEYQKQDWKKFLNDFLNNFFFYFLKNVGQILDKFGVKCSKILSKISRKFSNNFEQ